MEDKYLPTMSNSKISVVTPSILIPVGRCEVMMSTSFLFQPRIIPAAVLKCPAVITTLQHTTPAVASVLPLPPGDLLTAFKGASPLTPKFALRVFSAPRASGSINKSQFRRQFTDFSDPKRPYSPVSPRWSSLRTLQVVYSRNHR
jgi:hypothetical protein